MPFSITNSFTWIPLKTHGFTVILGNLIFAEN
jgi:hypothetical protein